MGLAPIGLAHFKLDCAAKLRRSGKLEYCAQPLHGLETVFVRRMFLVMHIADIKSPHPVPAGLEFNLRAGKAGNHDHAGNYKNPGNEKGKEFHRESPAKMNHIEHIIPSAHETGHVARLVKLVKFNIIPGHWQDSPRVPVILWHLLSVDR